MDFVLGFSIIQRGNDTIYVVVDSFLKFLVFVPCKKTNDALNMVYDIEIVCLHSFAIRITSNRKNTFINHFWRTL